ncbi:MAG: hypothetical protein L0H79_20110 [Intrasporangium sp.]|uniref:DUF6788 family protein n=1 Tax=Intrasporangium sp. TaxID=1925024 RepID=UPI002649F0EA|nr:DUF6788 family protein [Intrasporangium sp.]MDN5798030.1 hypothetical protein [Intrasporangium sp.]
MTSNVDLAQLEDERTRLRAQIGTIGDFRPGSLSAVMRRCGKANCACAEPSHPGHGPQHILTKKVAGKTMSMHFKPGPELDKVTAEVGNYRRFKTVVEQLIDVNEAICQARPATPLADRQDAPAGTGREKGDSSKRSGKTSRRR